MNVDYIVAMLMISFGLYCLLIKHNLIKMVIGLEILTFGIHLFLISMGYREGGIAPIVTSTNPASVVATMGVDPLPQALVLTSIVIDVCVTAMLLSLAIYAYKHYKTLDTSELRRLKG
ncbi:MAG: cation:proton antiporter [Hadesarchaea archaeon CG08_land_8_20_14_0_20_51_8]|nr:MAG: cation:proton antiporter [Hadesarchaea archaeon CG08_land_8_20_14_0_20_51_8]